MRGAGFPSLDHLVALTDDVGIFQHARADIPNRNFGYCTDDVSRALIVAIEAARRPATEAVGSRLTATYLAFLLDAQQPDGWFHNFMGYDRRWQDARGTHDSFGRALWGLGVAAARAPRTSWRTVARELADRALPRLAGVPYLHSRAYAALGLIALAGAYPEAGYASHVRAALEPLRTAFSDHAGDDWAWCADAITYDAGRLCEALVRGGMLLGDAALTDVGVRMFRFLSDIVVEDGIFVPVGNDGWYPRGGKRARYGQQPLEAAAFVDAALAVRALTGDVRDQRLADIAAAWFFGGNTHRVVLVHGGGCRDGLDRHGASENMGAESTLSYLLAAIALADEGRISLRLAR
jgi:hypothetical protein